jgi:membrane protease subunit HflK
MREVVSDRTVDEVITIGRQEIETEALTKMQALSTSDLFKFLKGMSPDGDFGSARRSGNTR